MLKYLIQSIILFFIIFPFLALFIDAFRVCDCANTMNLVTINSEAISIILSFTNFTNIFQFYYLYGIFISTLIAFFTAILLIPFCTAFLYEIKNYKQKKLLLTLMFLPFFIPFLIKTYIWVYISEYYLNSILNKSMYVLCSTILFCCYFHMPLTLMLINDAIDQINPDILDTAKDLGCSKYQVFYRVLIPIIKQKLKSVFALIFVLVFGEFIFPEIISSGSIPTIGNAINEEILLYYNTPMASSLTIVMLLWCTIFLSILNLLVK